MATKLEGLCCPYCGGVFHREELGDPVYECSRCGGQDFERRCPSCHVFMAKVADCSCPECESALDEDPEEVVRWQSADGSLFETEVEADAWDAPSAVAAREQKAAESKAWLDAEIAKSKAEAAERGARMAPRVAVVLEGLTRVWGGWAGLIGAGTRVSGHMGDLIENLRWVHRYYEQGELGGFTTPLPITVLALVVDGSLVAEVVQGLDYSLSWGDRQALLEKVKAVVEPAVPELEPWFRFFEFGGAVHIDTEIVVDVLERLLDGR